MNPEIDTRQPNLGFSQYMEQQSIHILRLQVGSTLKRSSERDFIGIFKVSTYRKT
jgi:hypothetical protein